MEKQFHVPIAEAEFEGRFITPNQPLVVVGDVSEIAEVEANLLDGLHWDINEEGWDNFEDDPYWALGGCQLQLQKTADGWIAANRFDGSQELQWTQPADLSELVKYIGSHIGRFYMLPYRLNFPIGFSERWLEGKERGEDLQMLRGARKEDLEQLAEIHGLNFPRELNSDFWARANLEARPMVDAYVAQADNQVVGYIFWEYKGGFREQAVVELKQVAVHPHFQSNGVGKALIGKTWEHIKRWPHNHIKATLVTTRADNARAIAVYKQVLGAEEVAVIPNLYSGDEVIMLAREEAQRE